MITIILPVYNEENRIRSCLELIANVSASKDYEFLLIDDYSSDRTSEIAMNIASSYKNKLNLKILRNEKRIGKGATIIKGIENAKSKIVGFLDIDLPNNISDIEKMRYELENGYDIVIGSRYIKGSRADRSLVRNTVSLFYNKTINLLFGSRIKDHQCGIKIFKRDSILPIIRQIKENGVFMDTEMIIKAQKARLKIKEFPIDWREIKEGELLRGNLTNLTIGFFNFTKRLKYEGR